jgi:uncharacterized protein YggU (UPF0235/DUF167 family)
VTDAAPWHVGTDGLALVVRLTPRGGRDAIDGVERLADGRAVLKARVRAAASDGEANAALVRLVAKSLKVAPREVSLVAGDTARIKRLKVAGAGPALAAALERMLLTERPAEST